MNKAQTQVREFHLLIKQPTSPAEPKFRNPELRAKLILEEAIETVTALVGSKKACEILALFLDVSREAHRGDPTGPNFIEAIDGVVDTLFVCYGTAEDMGIDIEPFFDEVYRANMNKRGAQTGQNPVGKAIKPEGWKPPDIAGVLEKLVAARSAVV